MWGIKVIYNSSNLKQLRGIKQTMPKIEALAISSHYLLLKVILSL